MGIPPDISPIYELQENDVFCAKQLIKKFECHPSIIKHQHSRKTYNKGSYGLEH